MTSNTSQIPEGEDTTPDTIILDIGKHAADRVKKLRKGKGKLLRKVNDAVGQLREAGQIKADAQVVLIVVREERGLLDMLSDDD